MAKKRANGEGNIRKRKDGRWEGRYTAGVDPETGKPIAKSVLARTQRECKEKLQKAMEELEKIDVTKRRDYTVGEWAQLWYENYAKPSVRASTAAYYKNYIDQHIMPRIGDIKLTALTTLQIQKFYNETKAHGRVQRYENMDDLSLSNKTIRGLHTMLRQCLEQAVTERLIPYNPANGCRLPKKEKKKMQIIPPEKIRDYLKAAEEWGVLPMFYLELSTGLRRGELVALLWSDLNLQTKTLTVSKSVSRGKGELVVTEPKTENSVREIYLSDEAIRLLVEDCKNHPFSPYMFPSPKTGGMYGPDCVGRIHKKLLEKAELEDRQWPVTALQKVDIILDAAGAKGDSGFLGLLNRIADGSEDRTALAVELLDWAQTTALDRDGIWYLGKSWSYAMDSDTYNSFQDQMDSLLGLCDQLQEKPELLAEKGLEEHTWSQEALDHIETLFQATSDGTICYK